MADSKAKKAAARGQLTSAEFGSSSVLCKTIEIDGAVTANTKNRIRPLARRQKFIKFITFNETGNSATIKVTPILDGTDGTAVTIATSLADDGVAEKAVHFDADDLKVESSAAIASGGTLKVLALYLRV